MHIQYGCPSANFPHQHDMTCHLHVTNFMRHLNVINSLIYLSTHNLRGKIHITSSTSAEVPISLPTWLNGSSYVTNFMRRRNVTNSIFHLRTHRLRGKMRIKSSTAGKVPVSSPTWHDGSFKCHEVYEASKCHELKCHELNYASTYPQATREDAYKVINSCRSSNLLPTDSMYASWIQVHRIYVHLCICIHSCSHIHICVCSYEYIFQSPVHRQHVCVVGSGTHNTPAPMYTYTIMYTHTQMCMFIYISCFNLLPTDSMYASWIQVHIICVPLCIRIQSCTHVHICICICVQSCTHVHVCVCSYMHHVSISCPPIACMRLGSRHTRLILMHLCVQSSHLYIQKRTCSLECVYIQSPVYVCTYINLKVWIYIYMLCGDHLPPDSRILFWIQMYTCIHLRELDLYHVYIHIYIFVPLHGCMYVYGCLFYVCISLWIDVYFHVNISVYISICLHGCICIDIYMSVYVYI